MIPGLGEQLNIEIEVISKPRSEYQTVAYAELGLPRAPAVMLEGVVLVEGRDIDEAELTNRIRQALQKQ